MDNVLNPPFIFSNKGNEGLAWVFFFFFTVLGNSFGDKYSSFYNLSSSLFPYLHICSLLAYLPQLFKILQDYFIGEISNFTCAFFICLFIINECRHQSLKALLCCAVTIWYWWVIQVISSCIWEAWLCLSWSGWKLSLFCFLAPYEVSFWYTLVLVIRSLHYHLLKFTIMQFSCAMFWDIITSYRLDFILHVENLHINKVLQICLDIFRITLTFVLRIFTRVSFFNMENESKN